MEERISGIEDTLELLTHRPKKTQNRKKLLAQHIQEIHDTMKTPNLRTIGIKESEDSQFKGPEDIFNKIIEKNFIQKKDCHKCTRSR